MYRFQRSSFGRALDDTQYNIKVNLIAVPAKCVQSTCVNSLKTMCEPPFPIGWGILPKSSERTLSNRV